MRISTSVQKVVFCILLAALVTPTAWPQASTGSVSGTVRDQTGAVIPAASVTLTETATNVVSKTKVNEVGFYAFPGVLPGPYKLEVEAPGMQKYEATLTVQVLQSAVVNVAMKIGQTATEVQVHDVTPIVTVDNPTLGHILERSRIEQLPLNGRTLTSLLQTTPGMEGTRSFGLRDFSFAFSLDGSSLEDRYGWNTITMRQPGLDSIQEFKVENNSSSAKFSRPTNIVATTKGGTNDLHGSAFETNRNNAVGLARSRTDYYTNAPPLNRNEFGASAGGPVYIPKVYNGKNKTFWFFSYEALRQSSSSIMSFPVPTPAMRSGDLSNDFQDTTGTPQTIYNPWTTDPATSQRQPFSYNGRLNVIDPALMNPLAKYLLNVTQLPTLPNVNPNIDYNWYGPEPTTSKTWTTSIRVDQRFGDRDNFYGRYTKGSYVTLSQFYSQPSMNFSLVPSGTQGYISPNQSLALSWVHTFSPTFFNEVLVTGARSCMFDGTGVYGVKYDDALGLPNPFGAMGWPGLYGAGFSPNTSEGNGPPPAGLYNSSFGGVGYGLEWETQNTNAFNAFYTILDDNMTKIHGKHEFQFGVHVRYDQMNLLPQQQQVVGDDTWQTGATALYDPSTSRTNPQALGYTGEDFANFFIGSMNYSNQLVRGMYYARGKEYATYFQDNWRVTPRLTLNLGVRWDYWPAFTEKNDVVTGFDPTNDAVVLGAPLSTMYALAATLPSVVNRLTSLGGTFESWQTAGLPNSNLMVGSKKDIGPRLGVAYRVGDGRKSFVLRGGYRISYFHLPLSPWAARMRSNAPLNARFITSLTDAAYSPDGISNYGLRTAPTVALAGTSTTAVSLNAAEGLAAGCCGVSYFAQNQPDPRVQDWNFTVEKEVATNLVVRASYIGNHTSHLEQLYEFNNPTPAYIWYKTTGQPLPTGPLSSVATDYFDQKVWGAIEQWQNTGWGNSNGIQLEMERRYSKGYGWQVFYVMDNNFAAGGQGYSGTSVIPAPNQYLPGQVPYDQQQLDYLLDYQRDTSVPHHRVRWNWIVDLPFGKGKPLLGNAGRMLDRLVGGWQVSGLGSLASTYFSLPTSGAMYPTSTPVQIYGYKYPIQNCTSGACYPGYLWWNGYIPAYLINSHNAVTGLPNGYEGIPANYHPAVQPLWSWPATLPSSSDPLKNFYGSNTVWVPLNNGTVQRTTITGLPPLYHQYLPSVRQWGMDASLVKNIAINERFKFRLSGDFFNVLNHPGNPNSFVSTTGILNTRSSGNSPRVVQLSGRLSW